MFSCEICEIFEAPTLKNICRQPQLQHSTKNHPNLSWKKVLWKMKSFTECTGKDRSEFLFNKSFFIWLWKNFSGTKFFQNTSGWLPQYFSRIWWKSLIFSHKLSYNERTQGVIEVNPPVLEWIKNCARFSSKSIFVLNVLNSVLTLNKSVSSKFEHSHNYIRCFYCIVWSPAYCSILWAVLRVVYPTEENGLHRILCEP